MEGKPLRNRMANAAARRLRRSSTKGRVLFAGQSYYHAWYLSRELRKLGWQADVLNWDPNPKSELYYHGEDFRLTYEDGHAFRHALFYARAIPSYDIFHFSNAHGMRFSSTLHLIAARYFGEASEIKLLKRLGKKIVYSNSGCLDGVRQSRFDAWGPEPTCEICPWRTQPHICSDETNSAWGELRNSLADYQVNTGGNRADFNDDLRVHEVPEFYCLDPDVWRPDLAVPSSHRLPGSNNTVKLYHSVGNADTRVASLSNESLKSTHVYLPLVDELRAEGRDVELVYYTDVPNRILRYYQVQSDVVCDMLTIGWFGANVREAMMLGKPAVCFLRPAWLENVRREVPGYVEELPVVSATPETVRDVLVELIEDPRKRRDLGERGREFALKWHSAHAAARRFDQIYSELLESR
jgi:glycosyltransferase involved in cell wall biosynthesis